MRAGRFLTLERINRPNRPAKNDAEPGSAFCAVRWIAVPAGLTLEDVTRRLERRTLVPTALSYN